MGSSTLTVDDVGILNHDRRIEVGSSQSMVFLETDLPPIFSPTAEKYDTIVAGESITKQLTKAQLKKTLEDKGLNSDGDVKTLQLRATEANKLYLRLVGR